MGCDPGSMQASWSHATAPVIVVIVRRHVEVALHRGLARAEAARDAGISPTRFAVCVRDGLILKGDRARQVVRSTGDMTDTLEAAL